MTESLFPEDDQAMAARIRAERRQYVSSLSEGERGTLIAKLKQNERDVFEERAAFYEYDLGYSEKDAEVEAILDALGERFNTVIKRRNS